MPWQCASILLDSKNEIPIVVVGVAMLAKWTAQPSVVRVLAYSSIQYILTFGTHFMYVNARSDVLRDIDGRYDCAMQFLPSRWSDVWS